MCKLGRHSPVTKKLRDGIISVGRKEATKLLNESIDDWFNCLGDSPLACHLRLYAQVRKKNTLYTGLPHHFGASLEDARSLHGSSVLHVSNCHVLLFLDPIFS